MFCLSINIFNNSSLSLIAYVGAEISDELQLWKRQTPYR